MDASNVRNTTFLKHHRLRVWHKSVELVKLVHSHRIQHAELREQASRASTSIALNIAEGAGLVGNAARRHYVIARGSAIEVAAAYELASALGESVPVGAVVELATVIAAMLSGLGR